MWKFWIDVGGTFTDCLAENPAGQEQTIKVLSSSITKNRWQGLCDRLAFVDNSLATEIDDFWRGYRIVWQDDRGEQIGESRVNGSTANGRIAFEECEIARHNSVAYYELHSPDPSPIFAVRWLAQVRLDEPLADIEMFLGTTRGTNALLTRRGARTVIAVTSGFQDLLAIGEQDRPNLFELTIRKMPPLYQSVIEIPERVAADGSVLRPIDVAATTEALRLAKAGGAESIAICLLHSFRNDIHERAVAEIARDLGFTEVSLSSIVSPLIKIVPRAETTVLDAYLNPVIRSYADEILGRLSAGSRLQLMTSHGGLVSRDRFTGKDSVLSGPAGGVVGFARAAEQAGFRQAIGFDMGGTSTDVARFEGIFEKEFETRKAGVRIVAPILAIETVAAGGGSICGFNGNRLTVGPESAGSVPGPACYGRGGPLAITDINVHLGRICESHFPFSLDRAVVDRRLDELAEKIRAATGQQLSRDELARGFWEIANHNMASAIRTVSVAKGYDPRDYVLVAFGGAGPQHATGVADQLGISQVLVHPHASVLSAAGIRMAPRSASGAKSVLREFSEHLLAELEHGFGDLMTLAANELVAEGIDPKQIQFRRSLDIRFVGTEPFLNIPSQPNTDCRAEFLRQHQQLFGYVQQRPIEVVAIRVEATLPGRQFEIAGRLPRSQAVVAHEFQDCVVGETRRQIPRFDWKKLNCGETIGGPALIADNMTTIWVDETWDAEVLAAGQLLLTKQTAQVERTRNRISTEKVDPVRLEIFSNSFRSLARQMGITLQRTSVSVNVKDRLDFSCAIFNAQGDLVVNAPHIPVHLGAMSETVREVIRQNPVVQDGDVFVTNDPYAGGSHLPDVSVVTPVFVEGMLAFWVASRGHHAEIGGKTPGSMPPDAKCLADEGVLIQNLKLIDAGQEHFERLEALLRSGPFPSRNVSDNIADIRAEVAANQIGANGLRELAESYSLAVVSAYMDFLLDAAEVQVREALRKIPNGQFQFSDQMDNGRRIAVTVDKVAEQIRIDFSGTDAVSSDNLNANRAICMAAIMYVMRCLLDSDIPLNEGVVRPVTLALPECFLNPRAGIDAAHTPAIVGGNVETSQRIVDVLLGALSLAAASQGTMNNWLMGDSTFGYYETLGGGSGATAAAPGADAVHTHMSNTRLTDPEVLETRFPVRLVAFGIARGTGGQGRHHGGCGMIRSVEFLRSLTVSLLTSRRNSQPYGMAGGGPGASGQNLLRRAGSSVDEQLPSRIQIQVSPGDRLTLITPGGGGWGSRGF